MGIYSCFSDKIHRLMQEMLSRLVKSSAIYKHFSKQPTFSGQKVSLLVIFIYAGTQI